MNDEWAAPGSHAVRIHETEQSCHRIIAEFFVQSDPRDPLVMVSREGTFEAAKRLLHSGRYGSNRAADSIMFFDAHAALSQFMDSGRPDPVLTNRFFKDVLTNVRSRHRNGMIRAYGEMVDVLCENGQHSAALELEELWNTVFTLDPQLSILCGYSIARFRNGSDANHLHSVCQKHKRTISTKSPTNILNDLCGTNAPERTIYVIDDDASIQSSLARLLALSDWQVRTFGSAEAFLGELSQLPWGCVLLDIQMLGLNGLELLRQMEKINTQWPVIVMSGAVDSRIEDEALRLGARRYLRKPFDPDQLLATVQTTIRRVEQP